MGKIGNFSTGGSIPPKTPAEFLSRFLELGWFSRVNNTGQSVGVKPTKAQDQGLHRLSLIWAKAKFHSKAALFQWPFHSCCVLIVEGRLMRAREIRVTPEAFEIRKFRRPQASN